MTEIYIYGTGKYGKRISTWLQWLGIDFTGFLRSEAESDETFMGKQVMQPEMIASPQEVSVFISIADRTAIVEIIDKLKGLGFRRNRILDIHQILQNRLSPIPAYDDTDGFKKCLLCGNYVSDFFPGGIKSVLFKEYRIIGGGPREHCICPICGGPDRYRWIRWILDNEIKPRKRTGRVLHFAPEYGLEQFFYAPDVSYDYYPVDIKSGRAAHQMDITDIWFKDNTVDLVIANHVMEHIVDERKAFSEIHRILKQDGLLLLSVPICTDMNTIEDDSIVTEEDRLRMYGQQDHVRLYGIDYKERFENYGFTVEAYTPLDILSSDEIRTYGFIPDDIVMILKRKRL